MLKVGDWISIPRRDVDGIVTDITLNTVKVENFDKTIITVPTYSLVNDSFQNWNGMEEAGIRQVKRSVFIDLQSVRFLDKELKDKLCRVTALKEFIESKEIKSDLSGKDFDTIESPFFNSSQITNLGIFRFYTEAYLRQLPNVDRSQAIIMRQLPFEGNGLPLQLNLFTKNTEFISYENLQSEIVEHLLAIMNEFGLKAFQQPSGDELQTLQKN
jgi:miniconductance mechanosensitive channel